MPGSSRSHDDSDDRHSVTNRQTSIQGMHKWSTSPNDLPAFVQVLHKHLMDITKFRTLIQFNYVVERRTVCCLSSNHIDRIRHKILPKGTPSVPCNITRDDVTLIPGVTPPPAGPPPPAATPAAAASSAAPPSTPAPASSSTSASTPIAPGTTDQYTVVPETVEIAKEELAKEIAAWIDDEDVAEGYLDNAHNDGIVMLINLNKDSTDAVADYLQTCAPACWPRSHRSRAPASPMHRFPPSTTTSVALTPSAKCSTAQTMPLPTPFSPASLSPQSACLAPS